MLRLDKREPEWLEPLPGVRIKFAPIGIKGVRAARRAVGAALKIDPDDVEEAGDELSRELIRRGVLEWEGIGDADGKPIAVSAETIELLLADPDAFEACDRAYVLPWSIRNRDLNGSAASPNGTGEAATRAKTTVGSRAKRATARAARNAPTKSTHSKLKRPKKSGTF